MTISKAVKLAIIITAMTFVLALNASAKECREKTVALTDCDSQVKQPTWWDKLSSASFIQFNIFDLIELIKRDSSEYQDFSDKAPSQSI